MAGETIKILNADFSAEYIANISESEFLEKYAHKLKGDPNEAFKILKAKAKKLVKNTEKPEPKKKKKPTKSEKKG